MGGTQRVPHVPPRGSNAPARASFPGRSNATPLTPPAGAWHRDAASCHTLPPAGSVGTSLAALLWDEMPFPGTSQGLSSLFTRWWFSPHCFIRWQPKSVLWVIPICLWLREEANGWRIISCTCEPVKMPNYTYFESCLSISKGWFN